MIKILVATLTVLVLANAVLRWVDEPLRADACVRSNDCASCHQGSVPNNHTIGFLERSHGCLARENRASCMMCHLQAQCSDCHENEKPSWHSLAFSAPADGAKQRNEHMRVAAQHGQSCMECHGSRFQKHCSDCHIVDEWKR